MAASGNLGEHPLCLNLFMAQHLISLVGIANPVAAIMSTGMMLRWLGERNEDPNALSATAVDMAISDILQDTDNHPADLGGTSTTANTGNSLLVALNKYLVSNWQRTPRSAEPCTQGKGSLALGWLILVHRIPRNIRYHGVLRRISSVSNVAESQSPISSSSGSGFPSRTATIRFRL